MLRGVAGGRDAWALTRLEVAGCGPVGLGPPGYGPRGDGGAGVRSRCEPRPGVGPEPRLEVCGWRWPAGFAGRRPSTESLGPGWGRDLTALCTRR